jgi:hypothetical protein
MFDSDHFGVKIENTDNTIPDEYKLPPQVDPITGEPTSTRIDSSNLVDDQYKLPPQVDPETGKLPDQNIPQGDDQQILSGESETKYVDIRGENNFELSKLTEGERFTSPDGYGAFTGEEMKQIFKTYDHDINHLFSKNPNAWLDIRHSVSAKQLMSNFKTEELKDVYKPLARYINRLEELTGLTPEGATKIKPAESIPNFIYRALHEAKKLNKLDEI